MGNLEDIKEEHDRRQKKKILVGPPPDHDWSQTPLFQEAFLGFSEDEVLENSHIVKRHTKKTTMDQYRKNTSRGRPFRKRKVDKSRSKSPKKPKTVTTESETEGNEKESIEEEHVGRGMETIRKKLLTELQVKYYLDMIEKDLISEKQLATIFTKGLITLELGLTKMGLQGIFNSISSHYTKVRAMNQDIKEVTIKLLYRCLLMLQNTERVRKIIQLINSKDQLMAKIQATQPKDESRLRPRDIQNRRNEIIKYWLLGSRLYSLIMAYVQESTYFKRFMYNGRDMIRELKRDIMAIQIEDLNRHDS